MELTLENLIEFIIKKESESFKKLEEYEDVFGREAPETSKVRASWASYYGIIKEFHLERKIKFHHERK